MSGAGGGVTTVLQTLQTYNKANNTEHVAILKNICEIQIMDVRQSRRSAAQRSSAATQNQPEELRHGGGQPALTWGKKFKSALPF